MDSNNDAKDAIAVESIKTQEILEQPKDEIKATLASISNILLNDRGNDYALEFSQWMLKNLVDTYNNTKVNDLNVKIRMLNLNYEDNIEIIGKYKKKRKRYLPQNYPSSLHVGDIIYVNFGIGYCDEIGSGHYGIILSDIVGSMYLVAPLTSEKPKGEILSFNDLKLPSKNKKTVSYVLFNQIRFIHYRRLENIANMSGGRRHIDPERVNDILQVFCKIIQFTIDNKENV